MDVPFVYSLFHTPLLTTLYPKVGPLTFAADMFRPRCRDFSGLKTTFASISGTKRHLELTNTPCCPSLTVAGTATDFASREFGILAT